MRVVVVSFLCACVSSATVVYEFNRVDYVWKSPNDREEAIRSGQFNPENNVITGVKVYKGEVYVTVPRWKSGVPSTLNRITVENGVTLLSPYPDWDMNLLGSCSTLQYVQSMEIDPLGRMWIIDTGKAEGFSYSNDCPAKLVVYDMKGDKIERHYDFPFDVVPLNNFLNDIVLDMRSPSEIYAFISDAASGTIVVYDYKRDQSWKVKDPTMNANKESLTILGERFNLSTPVDGIALGPLYQNPRMLYYCPLASLNLYAVPVDVMLKSSLNISNKVVRIGAKPSQTDGMIMSNNGDLYFGSLAENAVYKWNIRNHLNSSELLIADDRKMQWVDTFAIDEEGYLWFTTNKLHLFFQNKMNFSELATDSNFRVMKIRIMGLSYLVPPNASVIVTHPTTTMSGVSQIYAYPATKFVICSILLQLLLKAL